jgi:ribosomal protein S26
VSYQALPVSESQKKMHFCALCHCFDEIVQHRAATFEKNLKKKLKESRDRAEI